MHKKCLKNDILLNAMQIKQINYWHIIYYLQKRIYHFLQCHSRLNTFCFVDNTHVHFLRGLLWNGNQSCIHIRYRTLLYKEITLLPNESFVLLPDSFYMLHSSVLCLKLSGNIHRHMAGIGLEYDFANKQRSIY